MNDAIKSLQMLFGQYTLITSAQDERHMVKDSKAQIQALAEFVFSKSILSNCDLDHLRFSRCAFLNCSFDRCSFSHAGFWESNIDNCSFTRCKFRETAFGGINYNNPYPNLFSNSGFHRCDLKGSFHSCEVYKDCFFDNSNIDNIDFGGAVFEGCKFTGNISNVTFNSEYGIVPQVRINKMADCDFTDAKLHAILFRGIDLSDASFAKDKNLLILRHGLRSVDKWFEHESPTLSSGQRWFIEQFRKDLGTNTVLDRLWLQSVLSLDQVAKLEEVDLSFR